VALSKIRTVWPYDLSEPDVRELNVFVDASLQILTERPPLGRLSDGRELEYHHDTLVEGRAGQISDTVISLCRKWNALELRARSGRGSVPYPRQARRY
jgi:hypothetical protein